MVTFNSIEDEMEFFAPNPELAVRVHHFDGGVERVVVIDDFYKHPEQIRELALSMPKTRNPKFLHGLPGSRVEAAYYFGHLAYIFNNVISNVFAEDMPYVEDTYIQNCLDHARFLVNVQNSNLPARVPHVDCDYVGRFVAGVYLNTDDECSGGTAFYKFKGSKYVDLSNLDPDLTVYDQYLLESDGDHWEKIYQVEMKFNRLILYRQNILHTPYIMPNTFTDKKPRLNQMFFM